MEAASVFRSSPVSVTRPSSLVSGAEGVTMSLRFGSDFRPIKRSSSSSRSKNSMSRVVSGRRSSFVVRACSSSDSAGSAAPIAPLELESPVGQFLSQILASDPHLVPAAVDQQLDQLQTELESEEQKDEPSASGTDLVLYRRIAEVKANERRKALEEILYALIVQKFMDANVSLVPSISPSSDPSGRVDSWPSQGEKLEQLHSAEAYEMIQNHLALILGNRLGDSTSVIQISKFMVGQLYAASVMYGYFLRKMDQRFQLEKAMKTLPEGQNVDVVEEATKAQEFSNTSNRPEPSLEAGGVSPGGFGFGMRPSRLRNYVMSLDNETIQSCSAIRSKEAVNIIEKHTKALFGSPEIAIRQDGTIDSMRNELIKIGFGGLRYLVLEAVTFGSFLWEVESYVDSRYCFLSS